MSQREDHDAAIERILKTAIWVFSAILVLYLAGLVAILVLVPW